MNLERQNIMQDFQYEYITTHNGAAVTVVLDVRYAWGEKFPTISLDSIWYDCTNVLPLLNKADADALEMEALAALHESGRK